MSGLTLVEAQRIIRQAVLNHTWERETLLGPLVRDYLSWKKLSRAAPRTLDQYERDLARLCVECAHLDITTIETADLMLTLERFPAGSWKRVRAAWSGFFVWARRFGHRDTNPMELLPELRPEPRKVYDLFTPAERSRLLKAQDDSPLAVRDRLGALIFQELGIRKEEARLLRLGDFDLPGRTVVVLGKGGKERSVPFADELWTTLMDFAHTPIPRVRMIDRRGVYLDERDPRPSDYIFFPSGATGTYGERSYQLLWTDPTRPMGSTAMGSWWKRCIERSGVKYRSLHMNRHTVGTELVEADVDAFTVRDWLGHADTRTTELYVHQARRRLRRAATQFEAARRRWAEELDGSEG